MNDLINIKFNIDIINQNLVGEYNLIENNKMPMSLI